MAAAEGDDGDDRRGDQGGDGDHREDDQRQPAAVVLLVRGRELGVRGRQLGVRRRYGRGMGDGAGRWLGERALARAVHPGLLLDERRVGRGRLRLRCRVPLRRRIALRCGVPLRCRARWWFGWRVALGCRVARRWLGWRVARGRRLVAGRGGEPRLGLRRRLGYRCVRAEEPLRRPHVRMLRTEHRRPVPGDPGEVAPRLVPVAQFVGDRPEIGGDPEDHRIVVAEPQLRSFERLLQYPPRRRQFAQLPVYRRQPPHRLDHVRVVRAQPDRRHIGHRFEQIPRGLELAAGTQGVGVPPGGAELVRCGHLAMLPARPGRTPAWPGYRCPVSVRVQ